MLRRLRKKKYIHSLVISSNKDTHTYIHICVCLTKYRYSSLCACVALGVVVDWATNTCHSWPRLFTVAVTSRVELLNSYCLFPDVAY